MQEQHTSIFKSLVLLARNVILCSLAGAVFSLIADASPAYSLAGGFTLGFLLSLPPKAIHFLKHVCRHWKPLSVVSLYLLGQGTLALVVGACFVVGNAFSGIARFIAVVILLIIAACIALTIFS